MRRRSTRFAGMMALLCGISAGAINREAAAQTQSGGWVLPADAEQKKNPHPLDEKLRATGKADYKDKCARCHGPGGLGDGPDADPDAMDMNLTVADRAEPNPDGVIFYKVWNGRK